MLRLYRCFVAIALVAIVVSYLAAPSHAEELILRTSDSPIEETIWNQGWWALSVANANTANISSFVGFTSNSDHRDFFTFFLPSSLSGNQILSATLLQKPGQSSPNNEPEETIGLFSVTTDPATLNNNVGLNFSIYNDLGTGTSYGQFIVPGSADDTYRS